MNEWGKVAAVKGKSAVISVQKKEECDKCGKCRQGRGENEMVIEAKNKVGAQVGDTVEITDDIVSPLETFFIRIGIPLADAIIGGLIGYMLARLFQQADYIIMWVIFSAIISGLLSFTLSNKLLANVNNFKSNRFIVTSIIHKEG